jgi:hypothetical protein
MKPAALKDRLAELGIKTRTNLRDDLVLTRADGHIMHFRAYSKSPIDLLDFRTPEERPIEEAIEAAVKFVEEGKVG